MKGNKVKPAVGIALSILCVLLVVGIVTFAESCGVQDDGSVSSYHWRHGLCLAWVLWRLCSRLCIFKRDEGERHGLDVAWKALR